MGIRLNYEITGRLKTMLYQLEHPDFSGLMRSIAVVMDEDHVRGVMAGTDKDGNALIPVKYRGAGAVPTSPLVLKNKYRNKETIKNWRWQAPAQEAGDNLTTSQYRKLGGPPLAPRGLSSRVIRNFVTRIESTADWNTWWIEAALAGIVNRKGEPFMHYHFEGAGRLPQRDLRGIRPEGRERIRKLVALEIRRLFFNRD